MGGGPKVPGGQEIVCHFSQGQVMVSKILDFIHKPPNYKEVKSFLTGFSEIEPRPIKN